MKGKFLPCSISSGHVLCGQPCPLCSFLRQFFKHKSFALAFRAYTRATTIFTCFKRNLHFEEGFPSYWKLRTFGKRKLIAINIDAIETDSPHPLSCGVFSLKQNRMLTFCSFIFFSKHFRVPIKYLFEKNDRREKRI